MGDQTLTPAQRRSKLRKLPFRDPSKIRNYSYWWSVDGVEIETCVLDRLADLALCKLRGFDTSGTATFPTLGNEAQPIHPGTSLCRLGFPFSEVKAEWDAGKSAFNLPEPARSMPLFPIEDIFTRTRTVIDQATAETANCLEASSPGLRGQSGGPIYDQTGVVWAIQSQTESLDLNIDARVRRGVNLVTEHQVLNVGFGPDVTEIMKLVRSQNVRGQTQS